MTEAIFGLIGVIVGAVAQGGWSWAMERRRETWAARKAGRLLAHSFGRTHTVFRELSKENGTTWGDVAVELRPISGTWPDESLDVLAGTVKQNEAWQQIAQGAAAVHRIQRHAEDLDPDVELGEYDMEFLTTIRELLWSAGVASSRIGIGARRWTPDEDAEMSLRSMHIMRGRADEDLPLPDNPDDDSVREP